MGTAVVYSIGKGGVGKTTCAAALALHASRSFRTLVVSLDPAHNLGDVLANRLTEKPREVSRNLWASEVNMEAAINRYLKESSEKLRQMYSYLKVINMEGYLDAIRMSPGIEEYATLQAIEEILGSVEGRYDLIVMDTPPTGLTLRVLALPQVSLMWGERIGRLREEILHKRQVMNNIHGERRLVLDGQEHEMPSDEKTDPVMKELDKYTSRMRGLARLQSDAHRSRVMPVMNPDRLSLFETRRALESLEKLRMSVGPIIVNKVGMKTTDERTVETIAAELRREVKTLPFMEKEPVGLPAIEAVGRQLDFECWYPAALVGAQSLCRQRKEDN
ncbi:ArsA family ATPase [Chloroflexota bacterium]